MHTPGRTPNIVALGSAHNRISPDNSGIIQPNIFLRKRKIKIEPDSADNPFIIRQIQGHEVIKRKKLASSPTSQNPIPSGSSGVPIRCGQCTFSHTDPNEVERHRN